jgi:hypothetical protein
MSYPALPPRPSGERVGVRGTPHAGQAALPLTLPSPRRGEGNLGHRRASRIPPWAT